MNGRCLALDSASMYFRAFYGVPESMTAPDGMPVNAVRGFLDAIARLVTDYRPAQLVAAFDADWRPQFRVDLLPEYKAQRVAEAGGEEVPDTLSPQVPVIQAVLDAVGITRCEVEGFEADDVLGSIAEQADGPVDVVTGDRDLFQLVDDVDGVRVLYIARGFAKLEVVDESVVLAKYGVPARHYADFAVLRGDASDGLPGVRGVGDKTAAALVQQFGRIEDLLASLADQGADVPHRPKLEGAADYLAVAPRVVRVRRDLDLGLDGQSPAAALSGEVADPQALAVLTEQFGLASSVKRLCTALVSGPPDR
ncbi:MAG: 5'-3' exonuclease [Actinomycetes bacterium]